MKLKGGLPPGWTKHMHKEYNRVYYHHKVTKRTQWEVPTWAQYTQDQKELGIEVQRPTPCTYSCSHTLIHHTPYPIPHTSYTIQIDMDEDDEDDVSSTKNKKKDAAKAAAEAKAMLGDCTLYDCLEWFSEAETLSGDNQVYCQQCKEHRDMTKRVEIWKLPQILICHFKRFGTNEQGERCKDKKTVHFPREGLDLKVGLRLGLGL
jgi:hypothetical protein